MPIDAVFPFISCGPRVSWIHAWSCIFLSHWLALFYSHLSLSLSLLLLHLLRCLFFFFSSSSYWIKADTGQAESGNQLTACNVWYFAQEKEPCTLSHVQHGSSSRTVLCLTRQEVLPIQKAGRRIEPINQTTSKWSHNPNHQALLWVSCALAFTHS